MVYFAGITDEAGAAIENQIKITQDLGWKHLELRRVQVGDGESANVHDLSDDDFARVVDLVGEAELQVSCFSSTVANWGKKITESFESSLAEAERCIPRMKALGTEYVRIMSFQMLESAPDVHLPPEEQMFEERAKRVQALVDLFRAAGLTPVHENCMNYGGMSWKQTLELVEAVPGLKLVFDTGNPVFTNDFSKPAPRPKQDAWEFYDRVRDHIAYVHIKDGVWNQAESKMKFCFPGEGEGKVKEILADLKKNGYDGGISIEPHMESVFHDPGVEPGGPEAQYQTFREYGRRLEKLWGLA